MEPMDANKKIVAAMIGLGACARLLPHPWNFTPILAIALYAGVQFAKLRTGLMATFLALLLSDVVMGLYRGMEWVYASWLIPLLIGRVVRRKPEAVAIAIGALGSSLSFFLTTNFAVWAGGHRYAHTAAGLAACYTAAIPFYQNQLLGDAFYTLALFGGHAVIHHLVQRQPRTA
jgi:hypothetical protein